MSEQLQPILALGEDVPKGNVAGSIGRLETIPVSKLYVDGTYQRAVSMGSVKNIKRIVAKFDWAKFLPVIVTDNGDGTFSVVDGQHRSISAATLGIKAVPCYVLSCTAAEAAGAFAAINGNVTPVRPIDLWFAELAAKDADAVVLQRVLDSAGVRVTRKREGHLKGETGSINVLRRALDLYGSAILTTILQCIVETGDGNRGMVVGSIIHGIGYAIRTKPEMLANPSKLFEAFDGLSLSELSYEAGIECAKTGNSPQFVVTRMINAHLRAEEQGLRNAA